VYLRCGNVQMGGILIALYADMSTNMEYPTSLLGFFFGGIRRDTLHPVHNTMLLLFIDAMF